MAAAAALLGSVLVATHSAGLSAATADPPKFGQCKHSTPSPTRLHQTLTPSQGHLGVNITFFGSKLCVDYPHAIVTCGDNGNTATALFYEIDSEGHWSFVQRATIGGATASGNGRCVLNGRRAVIGSKVYAYSPVQPVGQRWVYLDNLPIPGVANPTEQSVSPTVGLGDGTAHFVQYANPTLQAWVEINSEWRSLPNVSLPKGTRTNGAPFYDSISKRLFFPVSSQNDLLDSWLEVYDGEVPVARIKPSLSSLNTTWRVGAAGVAYNGTVVVPYLGNGGYPGGVIVYQWNETADDYVETTRAASLYGNGDSYGVSSAIDVQSGFMAVGAPYTAPSPSPLVYLYHDAPASPENGLSCWLLKSPGPPSGDSSDFGSQVRMFRAGGKAFLAVSDSFTGQGQVFIFALSEGPVLVE